MAWTTVLATLLLFAAARSEERLEPLLEELLGNGRFPGDYPPNDDSPLSRPIHRGEEVIINVPQNPHANCDEDSSELLERKFAALVPDHLRSHPDIVQAHASIFDKLDYCEQKRNNDHYLNLRTAILAGMFTGKSQLLDIPMEVQSQCLISMADEEKMCANIRQDICDFVKPVNPDGREYGSADIKEFAMEYDQAYAAEDVCSAMSAVLEDPLALEEAISFEHDIKNPVRNGIATRYLQELDKAARSGQLQTQSWHRRNRRV